MGIIQELRRRNVFRVAGIYAVTGWLVIQLAIALETTLLLPSWFDTLLTILVLVCFPIVMIGAWAFEMTPEGFKRTQSVSEEESVSRKTGRRLDFILAVGVFLLLAFIIADRMVFAGNGNTATASSGEASIAVLPFADMSEQGDQAYFADGISEELLNVLAQVPGLAVAGRTSSFAFKDRNEDLRDIGEILSVEHILEGSVRKAGNRVRVTAQLVRADNGFHVWSETYDRDLDDIFAVQDEIADSILAELTPHLMGETQTMVAQRTDISAYDLYLLAQQKAADGSMVGYREAVEALDKALAIDPDYVPALAWRGYYELMMSDGVGASGDIPIEQALENAGDWTGKALALEPMSADALFARAGWMAMSPDGELRAQAERYYELALERKPNFPAARNDYAYILMELERYDEAVDQLERALAHDPAHHDANTNLAYIYTRRHDFDKATRLIDRWKEITPDVPGAYVYEGSIAHRQGHLAEAVRSLEKALELSSDNPRIEREYYGMISFIGEFQAVVESSTDGFAARALVQQGRGEEAVERTRAAVEARPDYVYAQHNYLWVLFYTRRWDELLAHYDASWGSVEAFEGAFSLPPYEWLALPMREAGHRDAEAVEAALRDQIESQLAGGVESRETLAVAIMLQLMAGNQEAALDMLEGLSESGILSILIFTNPAYEPLRGTPRFEALKESTAEKINAERTTLGLDPIDMPVPYTEPGM